MICVNELVEKAISGGCISRDEAGRLLDLPLDDLLGGSDLIRGEFFGNRINLCAIVNARSGSCPEDCSFCAQSASHKSGISIYPLIPESDILRKAASARAVRAGMFGIVTSGRRLSDGEIDKICSAIRAINAMGGLSPCASLGELDGGRARRLKSSGLKRYHHNLECCEGFFPNICTTHGWRDRVNTVMRVRAAGMEICCGGIFGLGESWGHRIDLAFSLRELRIDSVPLNFLVPVKGTAMEGVRPIGVEEALRIIAVYRFILPDREIKVAGGREQALGDRQELIFRAGANGMIVGDYLTMKGRRFEEDLRMVERLGLEVQ